MNGCENTASYTLTVDPLPNVVASVNINPICAGDQATISANGATMYDWDNMLGIGQTFDVTPSTTTTYTVTGVDGNGCENTDQVTVTVNPLPIVDAGLDQNICDGDMITLNGSGALTYVWDNGVLDGDLFEPPLGTTTYTVIGTDANGCEAADDVTITVNPLPTVFIDINAQLPVCPNDPVPLIAGGTASSFSWSSGSMTAQETVFPTVTTTYTVTGTDLNGCMNTAQVTIDVLPGPNVFLEPFGPVCLQSAPFTLITGSPAGGTYSGPGVSNGEFDPNVAGVGTHPITYSFTDANGCTGTSTFNLIVDDCLSLQELSEAGYNLYPNPATDVVIIERTEGLPAKIDVYDMTGRIVLSTTTSDNPIQIDVSQWSPGEYVFRFKVEDTMYQQKVVVRQ